ncbi:MAG: GntR family transcriptional regulator [Alphaproteobacteria bacterium]|nr:GntR family transcriptional regulator [Alphaproteobacteria bacterium]MCZ6745560.1 GntR family transcriptional regulator [Alphaproteobacteria bacterium]MCZ6813661.1 GntR family transcriptional regulator [Alphaproteobacteria bacterium]
MPENVLKIRPIKENLSLNARIYDELKQAIVTMNIYDDDTELRLDERTLSEQFGISRTPLREALARLDQEGLVRIEPRRGIYIQRKSKQDILDMITVWAALESMAARLITAEASDDEIATLRGMLSVYDTDKVTEHLDEYSETNISFHQAIIALGKCPLIDEITDRLFMHVRAIRARTIFEEDRAKRSIEDHLAIVEALEARDTERAERLVREHTLKLRAHVARHVDLD